MSYPLDLDEVDEDKLRAELARREDRRQHGLCDYCGAIAEHPLCKFPHRHRPGWINPHESPGSGLECRVCGPCLRAALEAKEDVR